MKKYILFLTIVFGLSVNAAFAAPKHLITHNRTDDESNAFIDGNIPSPVPTKPQSDGVVHWGVVKMICFGHAVNGLCPAVIKMQTNKASPITLGSVTLNLETGDIQPKKLSNGDYTFIVNGPGESTIIKN